MPITPTPASCVACGGGGDVTDVNVVSPILVPSDHAEDSPHVSGDTGSFALAVRNDEQDVVTSANHDYSPISVNNRGSVFVVSEPGEPLVTTISATFLHTQARLLTNATPWTPADLTGSLLQIEFQVLSGTATLVDSNGTSSAAIPTGTSFKWGSGTTDQLLDPPTSVTPSAGGSVLATWVEN